MRITSSLVFFLLEKRLALRRPPSAGPGLPVSEPRIAPELPASPEPGILYISENPELPGAAGRGGVWIFCGGAAKAARSPPDGNTGDAGYGDAGYGDAGYGETAFAGPELRAPELLEKVFSLFLALQDWDNRMKDAAFEAAGDYTRLFRVSGEFFDLPFVLVDRNSFSIAWTENWPAEGGKTPGPAETTDAQLREAESGRAANLIEPYLYPGGAAGCRLCCNIYRGSHYEGRIEAETGGRENHPGRSQLLVQISKYIGMVFILSTDSQLARRQSDPLHQLVRDSIFSAEAITERRVQAALGEISWKSDDTFLMTVFQIADGFSFTQNSLYICRHLETDVLHSCAITYASQIIWLINTRDVAETKILRNYEQVISFIVREFNCRAGLSKPFDSFMETRNAYIQGTAALRLGWWHDAQRPVYPFEDFIVDYILERMTSELPAKDLLHPGSKMLHSLDRSGGTEYVKTLRAWIDCQFNMTQAAEKLGLHRTTLIRRLEKITEIAGTDFHHPKEMLQMMLSLHLLEDPAPEHLLP